MKNREAENAVAVEIAPNWNVSGTQDFHLPPMKTVYRLKLMFLGVLSISTALGQDVKPDHDRPAGSTAFVEAGIAAENIDMDLAEGNWDSAEKDLRIARTQALSGYQDGAKDVAEMLCVFDYQRGMLDQLINGRLTEAEALYNDALARASETAANGSVWWEAVDRWSH